MSKFKELAGDLFAAMAISTVVGGVSTSPPSGTTLERCTGVIEELVKIGQSRQSYAFSGWIAPMPAALRNLGWLITVAENRAVPFLAKHAPGVQLDKIISVCRRETDNAVLLVVAGSAEMVASKKLARARAEEMIAALSFLIFPRNVISDLFCTTSNPESMAWLEYGSAGVGRYISAGLDETSPPVAEAKQNFLAWAIEQAERLGSRLLVKLGTGKSTTLPRWLFAEIVFLGGVLVRVEAGDVELAAGTAWTVAEEMVPPEADGVVLVPSAPCGSGITIRYPWNTPNKF